MLNKNLCAKCIEDYVPEVLRTRFKQTKRELPIKNLAKQLFILWWNQGYCDCVYAEEKVLIEDAPPKNCPYILEQLLTK